MKEELGFVDKLPSEQWRENRAQFGRLKREGYTLAQIAVKMHLKMTQVYYLNANYRRNHANI